MVEPKKKKVDDKEQWKVPNNPPPVKSKRKDTRPLSAGKSASSLTSVTSATSLATITKSKSNESVKEMSDEQLVRGARSTSSLPSTTQSLVTLTGPRAQKPGTIAHSELTLVPSQNDDEPEIKTSRSSISLKTVRTPSRASLASVMSSELRKPSQIKLEKVDSLMEVKRQKETSMEFNRPHRASSHQRMSDIQIIEEPYTVLEKPSKSKIEPKQIRSKLTSEKSAEKPARENVNVTNNKPESKQSSAKPTSKQSAKKASLENPSEKVDTAKISVIDEYLNTIETIKLQNNNLEKIKRDMLSVTVPSVRKGLEKRYFAEEDKLNDELVKAMVLQSRCPYERWPEITVAPNIYDDYSGVHPHLLVSKARQHISNIEPPERKTAGEECAETTSSDESNRSGVSPDNLFKSLLDKIDKVSPKDSITSKSCDTINVLITHLLKKRKTHINNCVQCEVSPKNCRILESVDEELCRVCKAKLTQLKKDNSKDREYAGCECDDSKSSRSPSGKSHATSSSEDDQSNQDLGSLEDEQISAIIKLTQLGKPDQKSPSPSVQPANCKAIKADSESISKKNIQPVSSCEANRLLNVLETMASELKQITRSQNLSCLSLDTSPHQQGHSCTNENSHQRANLCSNENSYQRSNIRPIPHLHAGANSNSTANIHQCPNLNSNINEPTSADTEMVFEKQKLIEQVRELKAEKDELKFIMREQESQMCDYRNRYLEAKQEIEVQLHHICELEKCNECIEDRINWEMKQIQCKFEQNLKHLQMCLETETKKLKQCCREKEELREKLNMCCSELHKEKVKRSGAGDQLGSENAKLQSDLHTVREMNKHLERTNALQKEEIKSLKCELATLRRDTTAILCRSKERIQRQMADFNKRVYELEDDLAKERAHSCCATKEKERCCKLLENATRESQATKAQLKTLQAYVKTLCCQLEQQKSKSC